MSARIAGAAFSRRTSASCGRRLPLDRAAARGGRSATGEAGARRRAGADQSRTDLATAASPAGAAPPPPPPPLVAARPPLARARRARQEAIDARLDLHGLTQSEAHAALLHFLRVGQRARRPPGAGDHRQRVSAARRARGGCCAGRCRIGWAAGIPRFVIGFEDAHIAHGGEGALYVRLREREGSRGERGGEMSAKTKPKRRRGKRKSELERELEEGRSRKKHVAVPSASSMSG